MTRHALFHRLCAIADSLQAECERPHGGDAHWLALSATLAQVDVLLDELVEHPITETEDSDALLHTHPLPVSARSGHARRGDLDHLRGHDRE